MERKSPIKKNEPKTKKEKDIRLSIVARAREWIGTPFLHQGRKMGVGVDCAGIVVDIAKHFKYAKTYNDKRNYPKQPTGSLMSETLNDHLERVSVAEAMPGDIIHFKFAKVPQHVGILTDVGTFIHADGNIGLVVETQIVGHWAREARAAYRFKEIKN